MYNPAMSIQYTKVTWYSKLLALILFIAMPFWGFWLGRKYERAAMPTPTQIESSQEVQDFVGSKLISPSHNGKVFVAYKLLGNKTEDNIRTLYVWAYIQEYYKDGNRLREGTGMSLPIAIQTKLLGKIYLPVSYEIPRDGSDYATDVRRIFPTEYHDFIFGKDIDEKNAELRKLESQVQTNAKSFYKL